MGNVCLVGSVKFETNSGQNVHCPKSGIISKKKEKSENAGNARKPRKRGNQPYVLGGFPMFIHVEFGFSCGLCVHARWVG